MKNKFFYFAVVIIFVVSLFFIPQKHNLGDIKSVKITGQNIKVDLALTGAEQAQGLSGRTALKDDAGMLFVFNKAGIYPFWMKDMNFSIDIIWIGEDMRIIYIKKFAKPEDYPATYGPDVLTSVGTKYVLEVVSGFSDKNNLKVGDRVEFGY